MDLSFFKNKKFLILAGVIVFLVIIIIVAVVLLRSSATDETKESLIPSEITSKDAGKTAAVTDQSKIDSTEGNASESEDEVGKLIPVVDETDSIEGADNDTEKLMLHTPLYAEDFSIIFNYSSKSFTVTLLAIYNYDWQREQYLKDLAAYKEEALLWIESKNVDASQIKIQYIPEEAEDM
jgi:hypothetical protein